MITMDNMPDAFVSVIIPVFNDSRRLRICLEALEKQTYPKGFYEIIIVDNGSAESLEPLVREFKNAVFIREDRPGSYTARNKGISVSRGVVIAFTDSDCIPALDWIEKGIKNLASTANCGLVGGRIELFLKNPDKPTAAELYESIFAFSQKDYIEKTRFGATANVFTFREVIEKAGLFNENLKSSGDLEWGRRVFSKGYKQIYADDVCVLHPARHSLHQLYRQIRRITGGNPDLNLARRLYMFAQDVFYAFSNRKLCSVVQRFKVILVLVFREYAITIEIIRLKVFMGTPIR